MRGIATPERPVSSHSIVVPATAGRAMSSRDWSRLLVLGALWGGSFFIGRIAVSEISPLALVFYRVSIAALALHLWLKLRGLSFAPALAHPAGFLGLALLNNVIPFSLIFAGQTEIGAGLASIFYATTPLWTIFVATLLAKDERLSMAALAGIALGIAGAAVLIGPGLISNLDGPLWAKFAVIGASISYAFGVVLARRFRSIGAEVIATGQLTVSSLLMLSVVAIFCAPDDIIPVSGSTWLAIAILGLLCTALAFILYFSLIASAGATNASLVTLLVPASATLLGALFLGERLRMFELAGMALIMSSLVVIDGRVLRRLVGGGEIRRMTAAQAVRRWPYATSDI
jgi:drug/metabolite transporter (DMT)-like permease